MDKESTTEPVSEDDNSLWVACPLCYRAFKSKEEAQKHALTHTTSATLSNTTRFIEIGKKIPVLDLSKNSGERHLFVARSRIHGNGVFTGAHVEKGEFIIEYCGDILSRNKALKRQQMYDSQNIDNFMMTFERNKIIDATVNGNCSRYINNSCSPNCDCVLVPVSGKTRAFIFATQTINAGEELTYNYNFSSDELIPCNCGTPNCNKFININMTELGLQPTEIESLLSSLNDSN